MTLRHVFSRLCSLFACAALVASASPITTQVQKAQSAARAAIKTAPGAKKPAAKKTANTTAAKAPITARTAKSGNTVKPVPEKSVKGKSGKNAKKEPAKNSRTRKAAPPALLAQPKNMPLVSDVPMAIATLLADGEIDAASRRLYMEPASVKNIMLIREIERIMEARNAAKPSKTDAHRYYLNLGIAYHNLALFLKSKGMENRKFVQKAIAAYSKAKTSEKKHRGEVEVLSAALDMAQGKRKAAATRFSKQVDTQDLLQTYHGSTYLATYYAAAAEADKAVAALQNAKQFDTSGNLVAWAQIGDDFTWIRNTPEFQAMLTRWKK